MSDDLEQSARLVAELSVRDLDRSIDFYTGFGFVLTRRTGRFAVLRWDAEHLLFLSEDAVGPRPRAQPVNIRVLLPDVEAAWERARSSGAAVQAPPGDRSYGLRDFTVLDPDGFGLRFAAPIPG